MGIVRSLSALAGLVLAISLWALAPAAAQNPSGSDPTRLSVQEQQLLREFDRIQGRVSIPDQKAALLIQPEGRDWRQFRRETLPWIGGIAIVGAIAGLLVFYFVWGKMRIEGGFSGIKIPRFSWFERFNHWMTATCFIILALSGLNISFGRQLLMPLIGPDAFAAVTQWGKYAHNYLSLPFALGILFMLVVWVASNLPSRADLAWIRSAGGMFGNRSHPPAGRFNAGQKLMFWAVVLFGIAMSVTGYVMMFPFSITDIAGMQLAQIIHAVIAMLFVAVILGHIFIGSIGTEGAFEAMGSGVVDLNYAREHHSLWVEKQRARGRVEMPARPRGVPAE